MPASSCGLGATVRPVALGPSVSLRARDIIVSVLVLLKSPFVDVEDFDRVVGAGAGKLDPGALLLDFTLSVSPSILLVVLSTYSTGPGPPAEPLDCQRVALSAKECVMKGNNRILLWMTGLNPEKYNYCTYFTTVPSLLLKYKTCTKRQSQTSLTRSWNYWTDTQQRGEKYILT